MASLTSSRPTARHQRRIVLTSACKALRSRNTPMMTMRAKCGIRHSPPDSFRVARNWSMSAPGPRGCGAENGNDTERGKDRGENSVLRSPGDGGAEQRERGEPNEGAYGLGVHFPRSVGWKNGAS
jgi:hypothetical protein